MIFFFDLSPVGNWWGWTVHFVEEVAMRNWRLVLVLAILGLFTYACKKDTPPPEKVVSAPTASVPKLASALIEKNARDLGLDVDEVKLPTLDELKGWNAQFKPVPVVIDVNGNSELAAFSADDMELVRHFVAAADVLDEIFWMQNSPEGLKYRDLCKGTGTLSEYDKQLCAFIDLNYGRYDRREGNKAFVTDLDGETRLSGANFYDPYLTKERLEAALKTLDPEAIMPVQDAYTSVRTQQVGTTSLRLTPVGYNVLYRSPLEKAASELRLAADFADSSSQRAFLLAQAKAFEDNNYALSDTAWVMAGDSRFMLLAAPYEVYDDRLMGWKAAFEACVGVVDQAETDRLMQVQSALAQLATQLPIDKKYLTQRLEQTPIVAQNVLYLTGQAGAGVQMSAFKLPNDATVTGKVGSKIVMNLNFQRAKFGIGLEPISRLTLAQEYGDLDFWQAYFWHNFTHEASHSMGPGEITLADGTKTTVDKALKDLGSIIEEAKGDIGGFWLVPKLVALDLLPQELVNETAISSLPGFYRMVRFGLHEAHAVNARLVYNYLMERGVYRLYDDGRYTVDVYKFYEAVEEMFKELLLIEGTGDYERAKAFVQKYGAVPPEVERIVANLQHLPIDIRPDFVTAREIFGAKR